MDAIETRCGSMDGKLDQLIAATCEKKRPTLRARPARLTGP